MSIHHVILFVHLIGVVIWVGGMLFAHVCLRPATQALAPAIRLSLWSEVFTRFFRMVWLAIALLFGSGLWMLLNVGFAHAPMAWHLMFLTGLVMIAVFAQLWWQLWPRMHRAVAREAWAEAAVAMGQIRQRVLFNLVLGLVTIAVATLGLAF